MNLELRSAASIQITQRLRSFVEKKLRLALGRFGHRVRRVRVRLTDINGPKGGDDVQCCIQATLTPARVVTIVETRENPFAAVARASERVSRSVARQIARLYDARRGRASRIRVENQHRALREPTSTNADSGLGDSWSPETKGWQVEPEDPPGAETPLGGALRA